MPQSATIKSLPAAFGMMKAMQGDGVEWGEDYRQGARQAVAELLRGRMDRLIDQHLKRMAELDRADRRNGCYRRRLLTELGEIELAMPRTRTFSALKVPDQPWVKADLHRIMNARTLPAAWSAAPRFAERWQDLYPKAVACLRNDLDDLLTCFATPTPPRAAPCAPPMPSSGAFARSGTAPGRWARSRTARRWSTSCSPSSLTRTATRASPPPSP
jgi:hypothetical protein